MKPACLFILLFLSCRLSAERVLYTSDFFEGSRGADALGYFNEGTEVSTLSTSSDGREQIRLRVYVKKESIRHHKVAAGSTLYDSTGRAIGKLYLSTDSRLERTEENGYHSFKLTAWITLERLDPLSFPEFVIEKMSAELEGRWNRHYTDSLLGLFTFREIGDTLGFSLLVLENDHEKRMHLLLRNRILVAVIPLRTLNPQYFDAELKESHIHIIYFYKLKEEEEAFFSAYFRPR